MRVVVTGATGNVGTSLLPLLMEEARIGSVVGIARRVARVPFPEVEWRQFDVSRDPLTPVFAGADAVVHLAWVIQPSHRLPSLWQNNVVGSKRVFLAAAEADVASLVYASSVGAYGAGPKTVRVEEDWPVEGTPSSFYGRQKAVVEWLLDRHEKEHPAMRVVRLRPALIFKREAASSIRRLFIGHLVPSSFFRPGFLPALPLPGLAFQAVHSLDVARATLRCLLRSVSGPFNLAGEPVLDTTTVASALGATRIPIPLVLARAVTAATWRLRAQPTPPGWLDMAAGVPLMSWRRARDDLGWAPRASSLAALEELFQGLAQGSGLDTPALAPRAHRSAFGG